MQVTGAMYLSFGTANRDPLFTIASGRGQRVDRAPYPAAYGPPRRPQPSVGVMQAENAMLRGLFGDSDSDTAEGSN
eukprot:10934587-Alexandrium_andersonii.AAC.1